MSYYYNYYIGYIENGKIYPLGPFDNKGKIQAVIDRSSSFASPLYKRFSVIPSSRISEELREKFSYECDGEKVMSEVKYVPLGDLPDEDYILKGYFLTETLNNYERYNNVEEDDLRYDYLSPIEYARLLENELKFGPPQPSVDEEGFDNTPHSAREYSYSAVPFYYTEAYEIDLIRKVANMLMPFYEKDKKLVVLETEG